MIFKTYHSGLSCGFHGNFTVGVNLDACINDTVTDLIAKLIGMSLTYGF